MFHSPVTGKNSVSIDQTRLELVAPTPTFIQVKRAFTSQKEVDCTSNAPLRRSSTFEDSSKDKLSDRLAEKSGTIFERSWLAATALRSSGASAYILRQEGSPAAGSLPEAATSWNFCLVLERSSPTLWNRLVDKTSFGARLPCANRPSSVQAFWGAGSASALASGHN